PYRDLHSFPTRRSSDLYMGLDKPSEQILVGDDNCATRTPAKASLEDPRPSKYRFSAVLVLLAIIVLASFTQGRKATADAKSTDPDRKSTRLNSSHLVIS